MLLNKVTREHWERIKRDKLGDPEKFVLKISPRLMNENPNYHTFVVAIGSLLQGHFKSLNIEFTNEHRLLVNYTGMACYRLLEIAQLQGNQSNEAIRGAAIQMSDPNLESNSPEVIQAWEESILLFTKLGVGSSNK